jgi:hypothetical protein
MQFYEISRKNDFINFYAIYKHVFLPSKKVKLNFCNTVECVYKDCVYGKNDINCEMFAFFREICAIWTKRQKFAHLSVVIWHLFFNDDIKNFCQPKINKIQDCHFFRGCFNKWPRNVLWKGKFLATLVWKLLMC